MAEMPRDILYPFAWDERMARAVGGGRLPIVHIWRHPGAFVMGLRDRRLPKAEEAMDWLREQGCSVGVRNSGGAAVPLDSGVVNVSIVLPNPGGRVDFHGGFRMMADLIRETLQGWTDRVRWGEIAGSYCPGEYDVSIDGRKFCGIAQRRQINGFVVSAFIVAAGSGRERAELVRRFYEWASGGTIDGYPVVQQESMGSLQELAGVPSPEAFIRELKRKLADHGGIELPPGYPLFNGGEIEAVIEQLRTRYDK